MDLRFFHKTMLVAACSSILLSAGVGAQTIKVQTSFSDAHISLDRLDSKWKPKLKEMTDGRLEVDLLPVGAVVAHKETPAAVSMGILGGDLTAINYFSGRDPAFSLMGDLIAGYDKPEQIQSFCMQGGGKELLQKLYDKYQPGVHVVGCSSLSKEALVSEVPIKGVDDLQGVKIRAPEGLATDVFKRAGAAPVAIPSSEVSTALEYKVILAADASSYANNDASGLHKIAKYPLYPGIHSMPFMQFTVSDAVWNNLSEQDQQALTTWFVSSYEDVRGFLDAKDKELVARDKAAGDITVIDWPQAERDKFRKIAQESWKAAAAASPLAQEVYDAHIAYMKKLGLL